MDIKNAQNTNDNVLGSIDDLAKPSSDLNLLTSTGSLNNNPVSSSEESVSNLGQENDIKKVPSVSSLNPESTYTQPSSQNPVSDLHKGVEPTIEKVGEEQLTQETQAVKETPVSSNSNTALAIILLLLLYPVGLLYVWLKTRWPIFVKVLVSLPSLILTGYLILLLLNPQPAIGS